MARLMLVMGRSYRGHGVTATRGRPFVDTDDSTAAALVAGGFFMPADSGAPRPVPENPADDRAITTYDLMTVAELRKAAAEMGIPTKGVGKAKLADALARATAKELPPTDGSFTMIALQED